MGVDSRSFKSALQWYPLAVPQLLALLVLKTAVPSSRFVRFRSAEGRREGGEEDRPLGREPPAAVPHRRVPAANIWMDEGNYHCFHCSLLSMGISCSTVVEQTPRDREVMVSNPAGCLAISLNHLISSASLGRSIMEVQHNQVSLKMLGHAAWGKASLISTVWAKKSALQGHLR